MELVDVEDVSSKCPTGVDQSERIRETSFNREGTTLHHTQRPRLSPVMSPASERILVWCEIVG
jgi:hypothetical protein